LPVAPPEGCAGFHSYKLPEYLEWDEHTSGSGCPGGSLSLLVSGCSGVFNGSSSMVMSERSGTSGGPGGSASLLESGGSLSIDVSVCARGWGAFRVPDHKFLGP